ncbi:MAG: hypothetical protein V1743_01780 [Nanoarchaeota archaeon]
MVKQQALNDLEQIKQRNLRVEADKAWEMSRTRKIVIAAMTYIVVLFFLWYIGTPRPWLAALVPTIGFYLSTLTLPLFKKWWLKKFYKK